MGNQFYGDRKAIDQKIRNRWVKLSDSDISELNGDLTKLSAKVQQVYGMPMDVAEKDVQEFRRSLGQSSAPKTGAPAGSASSTSSPPSSEFNRPKDRSV